MSPYKDPRIEIKKRPRSNGRTCLKSKTDTFGAEWSSAYQGADLILWERPQQRGQQHPERRAAQSGSPTPLSVREPHIYGVRTASQTDVSGESTYDD